MSLVPISTPIIYTSKAIDAIQSGWISNHGQYIQEATEKLKAILKVKHIILMANGTCATHCLLLALKFKHPEIKKIYLPSRCYIAPWNMARLEYSDLEAVPIDPKTMNMMDFDYEPGSAVMVVHNLGNIINVPALQRKHPRVVFIEDNCEGLFGKYEGRWSGTASLASSVSFYGNKLITTGEGGAFMTNDDAVYEYIKKAYSQGQTESRYIHDTPAFNYRMSNIQAAFLSDHLDHLYEIVGPKKKALAFYDRFLSDLNILYKSDPSTEPAPWMLGVHTGETADFFATKGIDTRPFFYLINRHTHFADIPVKEDNLNITVFGMEQPSFVTCIIIEWLMAQKGLKIVDARHHLDKLKSISDPHFRYFETRDETAFVNHRITVALEKDENFIGYGHLDVTDRVWLGIYIVPEFRGNKIGTLLLRWLMMGGIALGQPIYITVDHTNPALGWYERNHFVSIGATEKYVMMTYS